MAFWKGMKAYAKDEAGMGTVEIILIIVVLVGLVLIFVGILMTALLNTPSSDAPAGGRVVAGQNGGHHDEK